ncbi:MAG: ribosome maturation factor RimP [Gammaproteobacteria bacterium]|jgi:ribosome maturation factor RimP|nr:ribosome maturation factor RimP [Chromatiales bacterium]MCP4925418.1 ribosome maturation factor RimP [Gammaproteobacteria bacterium]MDP7418819.1 ribosome maturation factor RimP [Gammaproteobacteria bacterium]HJP39997.1 ribosome maturation factor RimP [Gammaproteobacteria bacterium]
MSVIREQLIDLLEPEVEALGYELTDLEANLSHGHGLLRLFIDQPGGITLDDCSQVSQQVSALLDVEDPIAGNYNLEVSSPGADRKLVKPEHFDRFAGGMIKVRFRRLVAGRRRIRGQLLGRDEDVINIRAEHETISVELGNIEVARLVPDWNEYLQAGTA